ncbi:hypothetical protein SKAU_G00069200 [Synaphobranchus kaupii]|uniref:Uncharacterized protein n=1 Tax=Synaphobranchus kaupii TaxID=118154 RepID=A0A9Q1G7Z5_SYNKA|nr:hypothetical protein SKAU_G00069200 [Synaphobranchus kaupii]
MMWLHHDVLVNDDLKNEVADMVKDLILREMPSDETLPSPESQDLEQHVDESTGLLNTESAASRTQVEVQRHS